MVSPELLRRYPFFGFLDHAQLKAVALITDEAQHQAGETIFDAEKPAQYLYLLLEGNIDLYFVVTDRDDPKVKKEFYVGEIGPGDVFGISALVEPYHYTTAARPSGPVRAARVEAAGLRALGEVDPRLAAGLMRQTAKVVMERLHDTRVELAAARA